MAFRTLLIILFFSIFSAPFLQAQWISQNSNVSSRVWSIAAVDENRVWAGTENGTVLKTEDGGDTWIPIAVPEAEELTFYSIAAINADTAYFVGASNDVLGDVYKTTDGGQSWELKFNADEFIISSIAFWDDDNGMIIGTSLVNERALVFTTEDAGETWVQTAEENIPPLLPGEFAGFSDGGGNSLEVKQDSLAWFGTAFSMVSEDSIRVFRSTDRGQTWTAVNTSLNTEGQFHGIGAIIFHDALTGYAVSGGTADSKMNHLAKTTDGGLSWDIVSSFQWKPIGASEVPGGDSEGIVLNTFDGTFFSSSGGADWESLGDQTRICISFASPTAGWSGFLEGLIERYNGPGLITSTAEPAKEERAAINLEAVNPNPFTENTSIQFYLAHESTVRLEILNTSGQVVAVPLQETLAAGTHQIDFSGANLKGGLYICRLRAGAFSAVRKMVVAK